MRCSSCSAIIRPIVCLDIDGTLGNYHDALLDHFEKYFGREFSRGWDGEGDWEDFLGLTRQEYREGKLAFRQGGCHRWMRPYAGLQELVGTARGVDCEIWVTTTRPFLRHDAIDPDTREWLRRNNVGFDHLLYDEDKYQMVVQQVDKERIVLVLDDLPRQYWSGHHSIGSESTFLIERPHNIYFREKSRSEGKRINTVRSLTEAALAIGQRATAWKKLNSAQTDRDVSCSEHG